MSHLLSTITPTLGGSSIRDIAEQVATARSAVRAACDAVARIEIHPRDYGGREQTQIDDMAARRSMILRLRHIAEELEESLDSIAAVLD